MIEILRIKKVLLLGTSWPVDIDIIDNTPDLMKMRDINIYFDKKFRFKFISKNGYKIDIDDLKFDSLQYEDILRAKSGHFTHLNMSTKIEFDAFDEFPRTRISFPLNSTISIKGYALLEDGWLPPGPFVGKNAVYFLDTCTYLNLRESIKTNSWMRFLCDGEYMVSALPILAELNTSYGFDETCAKRKAREVNSKIRAYMPGAKILSERSLIRLFQDIQNEESDILKNGVNFLISVSRLTLGQSIKKRKERILCKNTN